MSALLRHDARAAKIDDRYIIALTKAGFTSWDILVDAARRYPAQIRSAKGVSTKALDQIRAAFRVAGITDHQLTQKR